MKLSLYKYRPIDKWTIDALVNGTVHFKCPSDYNDPFDCRLRVFMDGKDEDWEIHRKRFGLSLDELSELRKTDTVPVKDAGIFNKELQQKALQNVRISCFSEINDNILMWSHYANSHKGICLVFETIQHDTIQYMIFDKGDLNYPNTVLSPNHSGIIRVRYSNTLPEPYNHLEYDQNKLAPFLWTKSESWSYEREWRMLLQKDYLTNDDPRYEISQLKGIIFGMSCPESDIRLLTSMIKYPTVQFYLAKAINDEYKLEINPL